MKKILIFLLLFFGISCSSNLLTKKSVESIDCPSVFFASENRNYLDSEERPLTLDNVSFKAEINSTPVRWGEVAAIFGNDPFETG